MALTANTVTSGNVKSKPSKAQKELGEAAKSCEIISQELDAFREENEEFFIVLDTLTSKYDEAVEKAKESARTAYLEVNPKNKGSNVLADLKNFMVSVSSGGFEFVFNIEEWRKANKKKKDEFPKEEFFIQAKPKFDGKKFEVELVDVMKSGDKKGFEKIQKFNQFVTKTPKTPKVSLGSPDEVLSKKEAQKRALNFMKQN